MRTTTPNWSLERSGQLHKKIDSSGFISVNFRRSNFNAVRVLSMSVDSRRVSNSGRGLKQRVWRVQQEEF